MAEGVLRHAVGDTATVHSAGSDPTGEVHPLAVRVLDEIGLDISAHTSKHMNEFLEIHSCVLTCERKYPARSHPTPEQQEDGLHPWDRSLHYAQ